MSQGKFVLDMELKKHKVALKIRGYRSTEPPKARAPRSLHAPPFIACGATTCALHHIPTFSCTYGRATLDHSPQLHMYAPQ
jgi:hypothetical protein